MSYDLESEVKRKCKNWLDKNGWFNPNIHNQGFYCHKGIADKIAIKGGRVVMIEFKTMSKKSVQSDDQIIFQERWEEKGGEYIVVRSVEELQEKLEGIRQVTL